MSVPGQTGRKRVRCSLWDGLAPIICRHGWVNKDLNSSKVQKYCPICTSVSWRWGRLLCVGLGEGGGSGGGRRMNTSVVGVRLPTGLDCPKVLWKSPNTDRCLCGEGTGNGQEDVLKGLRRFVFSLVSCS